MPSGMGTTVLPRPLGSHYLVVSSRCAYLQRMSSSRRSPCKTARLRRTAGVSLVAMPNLQLSTSEVRESFLSALAGLAAERRGAPDDHTMIGHEIRTFGGSGAPPRASRRACGRWGRGRGPGASVSRIHRCRSAATQLFQQRELAERVVGDPVDVLDAKLRGMIKVG